MPRDPTIGVSCKNGGGTPKSSISIGVSITKNHPAIGVPYPEISIFYLLEDDYND